MLEKCTEGHGANGAATDEPEKTSPKKEVFYKVSGELRKASSKRAEKSIEIVRIGCNGEGHVGSQEGDRVRVDELRMGTEKITNPCMGTDPTDRRRRRHAARCVAGTLLSRWKLCVSFQGAGYARMNGLDETIWAHIHLPHYTVCRLSLIEKK